MIKNGSIVMCIDGACGLVTGQFYTVNFVADDGVKLRGYTGRYDIECFRLAEI